MVIKHEESMLTLGEVAQLLHVHTNTLRRWSDEGIIGTHRITNRRDRKFLKEDIINLLTEYNTHEGVGIHNGQKTGEVAAKKTV